MCFRNAGIPTEEWQENEFGKLERKVSDAEISVSVTDDHPLDKGL